MIETGDGFGRPYIAPVTREDKSNSVRKEVEIVTVVGNKRVRLVMRDHIVSWDPYLNLVKASAYPFLVMKNSKKGRPFFPVPPVSRRIKDALIKVGVDI